MSSFSQHTMFTFVTLGNLPILPSITAVQRTGYSSGHHVSWMSLHMEHVARMAPQSAASHSSCSSTVRKKSGGSSEPHLLTPAARAASVASRSASPPAPPPCDETRRAHAAAPYGGRASRAPAALVTLCAPRAGEHDAGTAASQLLLLTACTGGRRECV